LNGRLCCAALFPGSTFKNLGTAIGPTQRDADVSRHSSGPIRNLKLDPVSALLQVLVPEFKELFRQSGERFLPPVLLLVYRSAMICEKAVGEARNFDFRQSVIDGAIDDARRASHPLFVTYTRRLAKAVEQGLLLGFCGLASTHVIGRLFRFFVSAFFSAIQR